MLVYFLTYSSSALKKNRSGIKVESVEPAAGKLRARLSYRIYADDSRPHQVLQYSRHVLSNEFIIWKNGQAKLSCSEI